MLLLLLIAIIIINNFIYLFSNTLEVIGVLQIHRMAKFLS